MFKGGLILSLASEPALFSLRTSLLRQRPQFSDCGTKTHYSTSSVYVQWCDVATTARHARTARSTVGAPERHLRAVRSSGARMEGHPQPVFADVDRYVQQFDMLYNLELSGRREVEFAHMGDVEPARLLANPFDELPGERLEEADVAGSMSFLGTGDLGAAACPVGGWMQKRCVLSRVWAPRCAGFRGLSPALGGTKVQGTTSRRQQRDVRGRWTE